MRSSSTTRSTTVLRLEMLLLWASLLVQGLLSSFGSLGLATSQIRLGGCLVHRRGSHLKEKAQRRLFLCKDQTRSCFILSTLSSRRRFVGTPTSASHVAGSKIDQPVFLGGFSNPVRHWHIHYLFYLQYLAFEIQGTD